MIEKIALIIPGGVSLDPVAGMPSGGTNGISITQWIVTILLIAAVLIALAFLIFGGIQWITSGGDKTKVETARKRITYALIGLIIVFLAFFIVQTVGNLFGVNLIQHAIPTHDTTCIGPLCGGQ